MQMLLNGASVSADMDDSLTRAVIISLFSWRRADDGDDYDGTERMGWWADQFSTAANDRIGSKLWQLMRRSITDETLAEAQEMCEQALQWLVDNGICSAVSATAERGSDMNRIDLTVTLELSHGGKRTYDFLEALNGNSSTVAV